MERGGRAVGIERDGVPFPEAVPTDEPRGDEPLVIDAAKLEHFPARRLIGIDLARGLALLGMAMVHITIAGPAGEQPASWIATILVVPVGLASVLFFVISGVSLSVIAKRRSSSALPDVLRRRGTVLLGFGLLLSATIWPASILEHYGILFLVAPWLVQASSRRLSMLAATSLIGGPVVLLFARHVTTDVADFLSAGVLEWLLNWSWSLAISGNFPLVVWFGFFAFGLRIGRLDLGRRHVAGHLIGSSLAALVVLQVVLAFGSSAGLSYEPAVDGLGTAAGAMDSSDQPGTEQLDPERADREGGLTIRDPFIDDDPRQLLSTEPHSNQVAWVIYVAALAMVILSVALLLPASLVRYTRPVAALGSISLSAYLLHLLLVVDGWHYFPATATVNQELAVLVGGEIALVVVCWAIVARWRTGPAERLLKFLAGR